MNMNEVNYSCVKTTNPMFLRLQYETVYFFFNFFIQIYKIYQKMFYSFRPNISQVTKYASRYQYILAK